MSVRTNPVDFQGKRTEVKVISLSEEVHELHKSCLSWLFRAQEPKAPVTYCDHALSGVRLSSGVCRLSSVVR